MMQVGTAISSRLEARFASELAQCEDVVLARRCADVEELLSAAESGAITVAALSPDFPGINGSVIAELTVRGARVLGVVSATSTLDQRQCEAWALRATHVVGSGELPDALGLLGNAPREAVTQLFGDVEGKAAQDDSPSVQGSGQVITIWGPAGSPGRTTCATHLARELARCGPVLLIDADTVAPSVAAHLGLLDEAPGVLAAARLVDAGTFNLHQLQAVVAYLDEGFDVLSGIGVARRWHELTRFHLGRIIDLARTHYTWIVLDIASDVSADESLSFDTIAPARCGAAQEALDQADWVIALAAADPVGLQRFVQSSGDVLEGATRSAVAVTKARDAAVGGSAHDVVTGALERFIGVRPVAVLPDASTALDEALLSGRLLDDAGEGAGYLVAMRDLCRYLGADASPVRARRGRWLSRRG